MSKLTPGSLSRSQNTTTYPTAMPFHPQYDEAIRQAILYLLRVYTRADPIGAAESYLAIQPYIPKPGWVYVQARVNWTFFFNIPTFPPGQDVCYIDFKIGECANVPARREGYERECVGEEILWAFCYPTTDCRLLERLVHNTLRARGAKRTPYPCYGCGVRHREHYGERASGGFCGVRQIIEYWLWRRGKVPIFVPLYND
ncbi:hypothetical protein DFH07DRAFT_769801 [Mycena maculata]|uniref:Bacteriophage T5 Orf172 DNA-binding domain-containing protein n=1 Tax=Mycena maculata TaxID=230809 RepID=A0AAD7JMQ7_9AGAR|nr:hypothetical protein DFH07DRAFT_769801 [Mycena maculata]